MSVIARPSGQPFLRLVLAAFTFDNLPTMDHKLSFFSDLARLLRANGWIVNLVSSPYIYRHGWASFSTRDFPDNRKAQSGDTVRIVVTDIEDSRLVEYILCTDADHGTVYRGRRPRIACDQPTHWRLTVSRLRGSTKSAAGRGTSTFLGVRGSEYQLNRSPGSPYHGG